MRPFLSLFFLFLSSFHASDACVFLVTFGILLICVGLPLFDIVGIRNFSTVRSLTDSLLLFIGDPRARK